jgi:hypothetical protein
VAVLCIYGFNSFKSQIKEERKIYALKLNTLLLHCINEKCRELKIIAISRRH